MNQSFYIGAVGAQQQQVRMNIEGHNISNINTYGFKGVYGRFASLMYRNMLGIDEEQLPAGVGTRVLETPTSFESGPLATTDRFQDYAIEGDGFFAVMDPATNEITFTRNGAFSLSEFQRPGYDVDENGEPILETVFLLADGEGRFVLSQEGGLIEVTDQRAEQPVGVFDYVNYDGIQHVSSTRFSPIEKNGQLRMGSGRVRQGMLEHSNVDLATEFTRVIESQRAYGLALRMVQTSDEIESTINGLRS
ncbi:MAG: flagellar hook basal-body protein [Oscillospiraceae bacterium]|nr:flagellar hook basal-body protein [Oscillospiraceae bacterium]